MPSVQTVSRRPFSDGYGEIWSGAGDLMSLPPDDVTDAFRKRGAVLFRGFSSDRTSFKTFTDQLCGGFLNYEGGASARGKVDGQETVLTVTEPSMLHGIPLHGEMYYTKRRPDLLFFYCERPAAEDGETTVADGTALYRGLSPETRRYFTERRIKYVCTYPDGRWQQLFQTEDVADVAAYCDENDMTFSQRNDRSIITEYVTSAVSQPLFHEGPAFINNIFTMVRWEQAGFGLRVVRDEKGEPLSPWIVDELQELERRETRPVEWRPGDLLMVDNTRLLHGRRAFTDTNRSIFVRLGSVSGEL